MVKYGTNTEVDLILVGGIKKNRDRPNEWGKRPKTDEKRQDC